MGPRGGHSARFRQRSFHKSIPDISILAVSLENDCEGKSRRLPVKHTVLHLDSALHRRGCRSEGADLHHIDFRPFRVRFFRLQDKVGDLRRTAVDRAVEGIRKTAGCGHRCSRLTRFIRPHFAYTRCLHLCSLCTAASRHSARFLRFPAFRRAARLISPAVHTLALLINHHRLDPVQTVKQHKVCDLSRRDHPSVIQMHPPRRCPGRAVDRLLHRHPRLHSRLDDLIEMSGQKLICHRVIRHQRHILIEFMIADGLHDLRCQGFELQLQKHPKLRLLHHRLRCLLGVVRINTFIDKAVKIRPRKSRAVSLDP